MECFCSKIIELLYCHTPSLASGVSFIRYMILDTVTNVLYLFISRSPTASSVNEATAFRAIRDWYAVWRKENAYYNCKRLKYSIHMVQWLLWIPAKTPRVRRFLEFAHTRESFVTCYRVRAESIMHSVPLLFADAFVPHGLSICW